MAYILNTEEDTRRMLAAIGAKSVGELFESIPASVRPARPLDLPDPLAELELTEVLTELAGENLGASERICFLGGGAYDHFIPAVVDALAGRGEFFTAYTPYQAEASQGTLQATFEYQTLMCQLTGMDVSNASLYDGGSAVAEAVIMALASSGDRSRIVVSGAMNPEYRSILRTYLANFEIEIKETPVRDGKTDPADLEALVDGHTAAVLFQQPNYLGLIEPADALTAAAHARGALAISSFDPVSLGLLRSPGAYGADIACAEGQSLGVPLSYGGPYLGILTCRDAFVRKLPGRIVGQTTDSAGRRAWTLTLQTREQHIRRQKATSNICTNQALLALRASIHLAVLGPRGLRQAAELSARKAHYAAERLALVPGIKLAHSGPFFKEFAIIVDRDPARVLESVLDAGYHGGLPLAGSQVGLENAILVAVTEKRTKAEIDGLAEAYRRALRD